MTDFVSLGAFAKHLGGLVVATEAIKHERMEKACQLLQQEVKDTIGVGWPDWPALAPSTVAKKGHDRPLEETGELRDSIEYAITHEGFLDHQVIGEVGSNLDKAVYNELGTSHAPPRSFLAQTAIENEGEIVRILGHESIRELLDGHGTI